MENKKEGCKNCHFGEALSIHERCSGCGLVNELSYSQRKELNHGRTGAIVAKGASGEVVVVCECSYGSIEY